MSRSSKSLLDVLVVGVSLFFISGLQAQTIVSARSGLIHYVMGEAWLGDQRVEPKAGEFPSIPENGEFHTGEGRAEVLLNTGTFLRLGEYTRVKMLSTRLADTRVAILEGSVLIEAADILDDNRVTLLYNDASVEVLKRGVYRIDANPPLLKVYDGQAAVAVAGQSVTVKESRMLVLDGKSTETEKFNNEIGDSLYRWSKRRSQAIAMANAAAARSLSKSGSHLMQGGWYWNPYYGMFTYIPRSGVIYSPFGFAYYAPSSFHQLYAPAPVLSHPGFGRVSRGFDPVGGYPTGPRGVGPAVSGAAAQGGAPAASSAGAAASRGGGVSRGASVGGGRSR